MGGRRTLSCEGSAGDAVADIAQARILVQHPARSGLGGEGENDPYSKQHSDVPLSNHCT